MHLDLNYSVQSWTSLVLSLGALSLLSLSKARMASTPHGAGEGTHGAHHHSGRRLRQLLHPSGKRIHIAAYPEEHERFKLRLTSSEPDEDFDILACLPLADGLSSLQLISTTTGLIVFTLMIEVWGQTPKEDCFWKDRRKCKYSAECRVKRKVIDDALKAGVTVDVAELARDGREKPEKRLYEPV